MTQLSSPKGRVGGSNLTETIRPAVSLLTVTQNAVGSLFALWHGSRHSRSVTAQDAQLLYKLGSDWEALYAANLSFNDPDKAEVEANRLTEIAEYILSCYPEYVEQGVSHAIRQIAKMNLIANVPSAEAVQFTFVIDNATVGFREQLARSKTSSIWTQTSRTADLTQFDSNRSEFIEFYGGEEAVNVYDDAVQVIRDAYKQLRDLGVPTEEIRLAPEARTHRVYWMINSRFLVQVLKKRVDWIAQMSFFGPVISDISKILRDEVDDMFLDFIGKPEVDIKDGRVVRYKYDNEVEDRYYQRDPQPVCPLWMNHHNLVMPEHTDLKFYDAMKAMYIQIWSDEVLEAIDWDRNNPERIGKFDRPLSWFRDQGALDRLDGMNTEYNPARKEQ